MAKSEVGDEGVEQGGDTGRQQPTHRSPEMRHMPRWSVTPAHRGGRNHVTVALAGCRRYLHDSMGSDVLQACTPCFAFEYTNLLSCLSCRLPIR